jgi:hypothetical protein
MGHETQIECNFLTTDGSVVSAMKRLSGDGYFHDEQRARVVRACDCILECENCYSEKHLQAACFTVDAARIGGAVFARHANQRRAADRVGTETDDDQIQRRDMG